MNLWYPECFLERACENLGEMFQYATKYLRYSLDEFHNLFVQSGTAHAFQAGSIDLICAASGQELGNYVLWKFHKAGIETPVFVSHGTDAYFAGSFLARYQFATKMSFEEIFAGLPVSRIAEFHIRCQHMDDFSVLEMLHNEFLAHDAAHVECGM